MSIEKKSIANALCVDLYDYKLRSFLSFSGFTLNIWIQFAHSHIDDDDDDDDNGGNGDHAIAISVLFSTIPVYAIIHSSTDRLDTDQFVSLSLSLSRFV